MTRFALTGLLALAAAGAADAAGPFRRPADCDECPPGPRVGRFATPAYITNPGPFTDRPVLRLVVRAGFASLVLAQSDTLGWVGFGGPRAIRAGRVLAIGSPTPGRPGATAMWIASPTLLRLYERVRARRNGGAEVYHDGPVWAAPPCDCAPAP